MALERNPETRSRAGPTDAALVIAARGGESWAQEALFRRYVRMVDRLAYMLTPNGDEADDVVQDSFAEALDSLHRLSDPQAFAAWLKTIVTRTAIRRIRRRRLRARLGLDAAQMAHEPEVVAQTAPPDVGAELRCIYGCINRLPSRVRVALVLRRVDGLTVGEVAARMETSEGTVKRLLRKADRRLCRFLSAGGAP